MSALSIIGPWAILLSFCSILTCAAQMIFLKKINLIAACRVSIFLPFLAIIAGKTLDISKAIEAITQANDLPEKTILSGSANFYASVTMGLGITIFLSILYAITRSIYDNKQRV